MEVQAAGFDHIREGNGSWTVPTLDLDGRSDPANISSDPFAVYASAYTGEGIFTPAGKDNELSWGCGGETPAGRGIAACFSSLASITNNQHNPNVPEYYRRPTNRGKFCGRCCIRGVDPKTGRKVFRRINCGGWTCSYCGPRRARMARKRITEVAEGLNLSYFLTLTLDPKNVEHRKVAVPHLRWCFNKFREYLKRRFDEAPSFICILEFTQAGMPHLHVLFDRYIPQAWISEVWESLGGGRIVFIKQVTVRRVARYLSKYLTKDLILSAPKGTRRITSSRSIKLFPRIASEIRWELLASSIWTELRNARMGQWNTQQNLYEFISITLDGEGFLQSFEVVNLWSDTGVESKCDALIALSCSAM